MTVFLLDGTARHSELLARLGKHTTSRACLHIRRLGDVQLPILFDACDLPDDLPERWIPDWLERVHPSLGDRDWRPGSPRPTCRAPATGRSARARRSRIRG